MISLFRRARYENRYTKTVCKVVFRHNAGLVLEVIHEPDSGLTMMGATHLGEIHAYTHQEIKKHWIKK